MNSVLELFLKTREDRPAEEFHEILRTLRPDRMDLEELVEVVQCIEAQRVQQGFLKAHANVFGTGGDGTVNISSMSSMVASRFVPVIKVGTSAVTSRFGSADFMRALRAHLAKAERRPAHPWMEFAEGSGYIPLSALGFDYNEELREARCRLKEEGVPDLYKVVFPFSSYTFPVVQINGCAGEVYAEIFNRLAARLGRTVCTVQSEQEIDELMPGRNRITLLSPSRSEQVEWSFLPEQRHRVGRIFRERHSMEDTIELFQDALSARGPHTPPDLLVVHETLLQNAALVVACFQAVTSEPAVPLPELMASSLSLLQTELHSPHLHGF